MTDRARFEEAFKAIWGKLPSKWDGDYVYSQEEFELWQAAIKAEREACAKVCDQQAKVFNDAFDCAAAIRTRGEG